MMTGQAHTAHTCEKVPLIYFCPNKLTLAEGGVLSDFAPTLLALMGDKQPTEMTGHNLAQFI
jgi:2,3-bisphosphoglycerate-independent phosphoglycerate mutase